MRPDQRGPPPLRETTGLRMLALAVLHLLLTSAPAACGDAAPPAAAAGGSYGGGLAPAAALAYVSAAAALTSVEPFSGPTRGGTTLIIRGAPLIGGAIQFANASAHCVFSLIDGDGAAILRTDAMAAGGDVVQCTTPQFLPPQNTSTAALYALSLAFAGDPPPPPPAVSDSVDGGGLTFQGYALDGVATNLTISPSTGPVEGGAIVSVRAAEVLSNGSQPRCAFGDVHVDATVDGASLLLCRAPARLTVGTAEFGISLNAQQFVGGYDPVGARLVQFGYHAAPELPADSLDPSSGPSIGNTLVTVSEVALSEGPGGLSSGLAESPYYKCRFGILGETSATYHSLAGDGRGFGALSCRSLRTNVLPPSTLPFSVSLNGQQWLASVASFTMRTPAALESLAPASGPVEGGTLIEIHGSHLFGGVAPRCRCGETSVAASMDAENGDTVRCLVPPARRSCDAFGRCAREAERVRCRVSLNGQQYDGEGLSYSYYSPPRLLKVVPACGSVSGGTVARLLVGGDGAGGSLKLDEGGIFDPRCHFGVSNGSVGVTNNSIVPASLERDDVGGGVHALRCTTPSFAADDGSLRSAGLSMAVSINGQQYGDPLPFATFTPPQLGVPMPAGGHLAGGTLVRFPLLHRGVEAATEEEGYGCARACEWERRAIMVSAWETHSEASSGEAHAVNGSLNGTTGSWIRVDATHERGAHGDALLCRAPAAVAAVGEYDGSNESWLLIDPVPLVSGVRVTLNGLQYLDGSTPPLGGPRRPGAPSTLGWGRFGSFAISALAPTMGSAVVGATVAVLGAGFVNHSALRCRWGDARWGHTTAPLTVVPATYVSASEVFCRAPTAAQACCDEALSTLLAADPTTDDAVAGTLGATPGTLSGGARRLRGGAIELTAAAVDRFGLWHAPAIYRTLMPPSFQVCFDAFVGTDAFRNERSAVGSVSNGSFTEALPVPAGGGSGFSFLYGPAAAIEAHLTAEVTNISEAAADAAADAAASSQRLRQPFTSAAEARYARLLRAWPGLALGFETRSADGRLRPRLLVRLAGAEVFRAGLMPHHLRANAYTKYAVSVDCHGRLTVQALGGVGAATGGPPEVAPLVDGLHLTGLAAAPDWHVAFAAATGDSAHDSHRIAAARVPIGFETKVPCTFSSPLALSVDAQHWTAGVGLLYHAYLPPVIRGVSPASGPTTGGTLLRVRGANLDGGLPEITLGGGGGMRCLLEAADAPRENPNSAAATYADGTATLLCAAPALSRAGAYTLRFALDGLDADDSQSNPPRATYHAYASPSVSALSHAYGPAGGGTALTVFGHGLDGGVAPLANVSRAHPAATALLCRFGGALVPGTLVALASGSGVRCIAPPQRDAADDGRADDALLGSAIKAPLLAAALEVSLNGVDYTASDVRFHYYPSLAPVALEPSSGPAMGGAIVSVSGAHLVINASDGGGAPSARCRYGVAETAATNAPNGTLRCASPAAALAGASWSIRLALDEPNGLDAPDAAVPQVHGCASVGSGSLELTSAKPHSVGTALVRFPARLGPSPLLPPLRASFELLMGGGSGGEGFSFCWGAPPISPLPSTAASDYSNGTSSRVFIPVPLVDHRGVDNGVCVRFAARDEARQPRESAEVVVDGIVVAAIDAHERLGSGGLRRDAWVPVTIIITRVDQTMEVADEGEAGSHMAAAALISVTYDGVPLFFELPFRLPASPPPASPPPPRAFIFGAATSAWSDRHSLVAISLELGAAVHLSRAPFAVSLNGQQWSAAFAASLSAGFAYYPPLALSDLWPTSGPARGGSRLRLHGRALWAAARLGCLFGDVANAVPATHVLGTIHCVSPPLVPGRTSVRLTLNGVDVETPSLEWHVHDDPAVTGISPGAGPASASTLVTLSGNFSQIAEILSAVTKVAAGAPPPARPRLGCRFGEAPPVPATQLSTTQLRCIASAPPASPPGQPLPSVNMSLSLNGEDWAPPAAAFTFYASTPVVAVAPSLGPVLGGTLLGLELADPPPTGSPLPEPSLLSPRCIFGASDGPLWSPASFVDGDLRLVRCRTPRLRTAAYAVSVSLNPHHIKSPFLPSPQTYTAHPSPLLGAVTPASGPADGGTHLTVRGRGLLVAGATPECGFDLLLTNGSLLGGAATSGRSPATVLSALELRCRVPPLAAAASAEAPLTLVIRLSLNGQQLAQTFEESLRFSLYPPEAQPLGALHPASGPTLGGTTVRLGFAHGAFDGSGLLRCKFGLGNKAVAVAAAANRGDSDGAKITCVTPASTAGTVPVLIARNGQQFATAGNHIFLFYAPSMTTLVSLFPGAGPIAGGTRLVISGRGLVAGGDRYRCRFGPHSERPPFPVAGVVVTASLFESTASAIRAASPGGEAPLSTDDAAHALLCVTPPLALGDAEIAISPNAQQFAPVAAAVRVHAAISASEISPESGPAGGGTLVAVVLDSVEGQLGYRCRWRRADTDLGVATAGSAELGSRDPIEMGSSNLDVMGSSHFSSGSGSGSADSTASLPLDVIVTASFASNKTLLCRTPPVPLADGEIPRHETPLMLALTLNGQQYTDTSLNFTMYPRPHVSALAPSLGPLAGGTRIELFGDNFVNSSRLRCAFGSATGAAAAAIDPESVSATFLAPSGIACISPALPTAASPLRVQLNLSASPLALLGAASPLSPPEANASDGDPDRVDACDDDAGDEAISSPLLWLTGLSPFSVGSAFFDLGALGLEAPLESFEVAFELRVVRAAVSSAAADGFWAAYHGGHESWRHASTDLKWTLENGVWREHVQFSQGESSGEGYGSDSGEVFASGEMELCRALSEDLSQGGSGDGGSGDDGSGDDSGDVGSGDSNGDVIGSGYSGDTASAGYSGSGHMGSSDYGSGHVGSSDCGSAGVGSGYSSSGDVGSGGSGTGDESDSPASILPLPSRLPLAAGDGVSLSFGDFPKDLVSERGAGGGLRVQLRPLRRLQPAANASGGGDGYALRVLWRGLPLLGDVALPFALSLTLLRGELVRVRVAVERPLPEVVEGGLLVASLPPASLSITFDETVVLSHLQLPGWAPAMHWQLALGARSGASAAGHTVRAVRFLGAALAHPNDVAIEMSTNARDFSSNARAFRFALPPRLDGGALPRSGSVRGNTTIVVHGDGLRGGARVSIAFDTVVVAATWSHPAAPFGSPMLLARTPPREDAGEATLSLALNGQQFEALNSTFTFFAQPIVSTLIPSTGPAAGGTLLRLQGTVFSCGTEYTCRFGSAVGDAAAAASDLVSPASLASSTPRELRCATPPLPAGIKIAVEVSLNGRDVSSSTVAFTAHPKMSTLALSPSQGPSLGGTVIRIDATPPLAPNRAAAERYGGRTLCRFAHIDGSAPVEVDATWIALEEGQALLPSLQCTAPAAAAAGALHLEISLNGGDDYSSAQAEFEYLAPVLPLALTPTSGPSAGGTLVTLTGQHLLEEGVDYVVALMLEEGRSADLSEDQIGDFHSGSGIFSSSGSGDGGCGDGGSVDRGSSDEGSGDAGGPGSGDVGSGCSGLGDASWGWGANGGSRLGSSSGATSSSSHRRFFLPPNASGAAELSFTTPPGMDAGTAFITVSANGQQFSSSLPFAVYTPPALATLSPRCGPVRGGTAVLLGGQLAPAVGSEPRCDFGMNAAEEVVATMSGAADTVVALCHSPSTNSSAAAGTARPLALTLNGQQFETAATEGHVFWMYIADPTPAALFPTSGVAAGGTMLTITGGGFGCACAPQCRFDGVGTVTATVGEALGDTPPALLCRAPAAAPGRAVAVAVSLNGQQFTTAVGSYAWHARPEVDAVLPLSTALGGGTQLTLRGTGFLNVSTLRCRFGAGNVSATAGLSTTTFGIVEATWLDASTALCEAPPLGALLPPATSVYGLDVDFDAKGDSPLFELHGGATVEDGVLKLTSAGGGEIYRAGWVATKLPEPQPPLPSWHVDFELYIGSACGSSGGSSGGADGFSFAYGVLDGAGGLLYAFGGLVASGPTMATGTPFEGLVLSWDTALGTLTVRYSGATLGVYAPGRGALRERAWAPVRLSMAEHGAHGGGALGAYTLSITFDGRFDGWTANASTLAISIPEYAPRRGWRFGLGAIASGPDGDNHWIDRVRISSPWLHEGGSQIAYALALSLNGQQYVRAVHAASGADAMIVYHAPLTVYAISPANGPLKGGTQVVVAGVNFRHGDNYTCRFGVVVVEATPSSTARSLSCVAPPTDHQVMLPFRVSLNARQYSDLDATTFTFFRFLPPATVSQIAPTSGPLAGGTTINVFGAHFADGAGYRCAFGDAVVLATLMGDAQAGHFLKCSAPAPKVSLARKDIPVTLEIAINAQQYTDDTVMFRYFAAPSIELLAPASGPTLGNTTVRIAVQGDGGDSSGGAIIHCEFGDTVTFGAREADKFVGCPAPLAAAAGSVDVRISANGQQYTGGGGYRYYSPPRLDALNPSSGPLQGGTLVRLMGSHLLQGTHTVFVLGGSVGPINATLALSPPPAIVLCQMPEGSPALAALGAGAHTLKLSPNAQQYTDDALNLNLYAPPKLLMIVPSTGPILGGTRVAALGSDLGGGSEYMCAFGITTSDNATSDDFTSDNTTTFNTAAATLSAGARDVRCVTPHTQEGAVGARRFALALNGQQFHDDALLNFIFLLPAVLSSISPSSGPLAGATAVRVYGSNLGGGDDYRCRFGEHEVVASLVDSESGGAIHVACVSPSTAAAALATIRVTVNGQQYTPAGVSFSFYGPASVRKVFPTAGSVAGSTQVTVHGANLGGGSDYKCAFSSSFLVAASFVSTSAVQCVASASSPTSVGEVTVSLTLNGQQFIGRGSGGENVGNGDFGFGSGSGSGIGSGSVSGDGSVESGSGFGSGNEGVIEGRAFFFYTPPRVSLISPSSGPAVGATLVTVQGDHFVTFAAHPIQCRFGAALVAATIVDGGSTLRCAAPTATEAAAAYLMRLAWGAAASPALPSGTLMLGSAAVKGEQLVLTANAPYSTGTVLFAAGDGARDLPWLEIELELAIVGTPGEPAFGGGGGGGMGFSISFGSLGETPLGELGGGEGLRVCLLTHNRTLLVRWDDVVLARRPFPVALAGPSYAGSFRLFATGSELLLSFGGVSLAPPLPLLLPPGNAAWRFGLGARTGAQYARHEISHIRLRAGAYVCTEHAPLEVTLNLQAFTDDARNFTFVPLPAVSSVSIDRGPIAGGTLVEVSGTNFSRGTRSQCRFGGSSIVPATVDADAPHRLWCVAPPHEEATVALEMSSNGQQYTQSSAAFTYYELVLSALSPPSALRSGGTLTTIRGFGIGSGASGGKYVCQFIVDSSCEFGSGEGSSSGEGSGSGESRDKGNPYGACASGAGVPPQLKLRVPATYEPRHDVVVCLSPALGDKSAPRATVAVSTNGQQFTEEELSMELHQLTVTKLEPSHSLWVGGQPVTLRLDGLSPEMIKAGISCRFQFGPEPGRWLTASSYNASTGVDRWWGSAIVPATAVASDEVRCDAPPAEAAGATRRLSFEFGSSGRVDCSGGGGGGGGSSGYGSIGESISCSAIGGDYSLAPRPSVWLLGGAVVADGVLKLTQRRHFEQGAALLTPPGERTWSSFDLRALVYIGGGQGGLEAFDAGAGGHIHGGEGFSVLYGEISGVAQARAVLEVAAEGFGDAPSGDGASGEYGLGSGLGETGSGTGMLDDLDNDATPAAPLYPFVTGLNASGLGVWGGGTGLRLRFHSHGKHFGSGSEERIEVLCANEVHHTIPLPDGWPKSTWVTLRIGLHTLDSPDGLLIDLNGRTLARNLPVCDTAVLQSFAGAPAAASPAAACVCALAPTPSWRFALAAHTGLALDNHWFDNVTLSGDTLVRPIAQRLEVSANGQQFTADGPTFTYDARVFVSGFSPSSGPVAGGTTVRVLGSMFEHGLEYTCAFGASSVNATLIATVPAREGAGEMECGQTPTLARAGAVDFGVSLDAGLHVYSSTARSQFGFYQAIASHVFPTSGPVAGGALLRVLGSGLGGGSDYHCRYVVLGDEYTVVVLAAEAFDDAANEVHCRLPPGLSAADATSLSVSLNGQQFENSLALEMSAIAAVGAISPTSGPVLGGTRLELFGSGFGPHEWAFRFEAPSSGAIGPNPHPNGIALLSTLNETAARCETPPADEAGVALQLVLGSLPRCLQAPSVWPPPLRAHACECISGHAVSSDDAPLLIDDGVAALLTRASSQLTGAAILCPGADEARRLGGGLGYFVARFNVETRAGNGRGDGFSFGFGLLRQGMLGAASSGPGLVVAFRQRDAVLIVSNRALELLRVPLPQWVTHMRCRIAYGVDGLSVREHTLGLLVSGLTLDNWHPQPDWVVSVGATSGQGTGNYVLGRFAVGFGAHVASRAVTLSLSINAQQFSRQGVNFTYYAPPIISSVAPTHGPAAGGSRVVLSGRNLADGSHYLCAFGKTSTAASYHRISRTVACLTPVAAVGTSSLRLTLNGQQLTYTGGTYRFQPPPGAPTNRSVSFDYYPPPTISIVTPDIGPASGGTRVRVYGHGLQGGAQYHCRFQVLRSDPNTGASSSGDVGSGSGSGLSGDIVADSGSQSGEGSSGNLGLDFGASQSDSSTASLALSVLATLDGSTLLCVSPAAATGVAYLEVAINSQDFTTSRTIFTFHSLLVVSSIEPAFGIFYGGTAIVVRGEGLGLSMVGLHCRFGYGSSAWYDETAHRWRGETVVAASYDDGAARCVTPTSAQAGVAHLAPEQISVELSLNAQQFSSSEVSFTYLTAARVSSSSPSSGPLSGSTSVRVFGADFASGLAYRCRFGSTIVPASSISGEELACDSPAQASVGSASLEVSLDAHNFTSDGVSFVYYEQAAVDEVAPRGGSKNGGALLTVDGLSFGGGSDYRCRFGLTVVRAHLTSSGNLSCTSPSVDVESPVGFEVSLNGQQYSNSGKLFSYGPAEVVSSLSPSSGVSHGSTLVRVSGSNFQQFTERVCRFGLSETAATWVSDELLHCLSEPSETAGASASASLGFSSISELDGLASLYSRSPSDGAVREGTLVLTDAMSSEQRSLIVEVPLFAALRERFEVRFDLMIRGNGTSGEGVSACIGPLPDVWFGERGAGDGLCVLLLTRVGRLELLYAGVSYRSVQLDMSSLRKGRAVPVLMVYSTDGLGVRVDGLWLVRRQLLSAWSPDASWRFGIGARTGAGADDEHRIDNVRLVSGSAHRAGALSVEVSSNGQQFSLSAVPFTYTAPVVISHIFPERGPASGSTQVMVSGSNMASGSEYTCRFGGISVEASFEVSNRSVFCASPLASDSSGLVPFEVSLNAQEYVTSSIGFSYYSPPTVLSVTPIAGPAAGGTRVRVYGAGLAVGREYRCRFELLEFDPDLGLGSGFGSGSGSSSGFGSSSVEVESANSLLLAPATLDGSTLLCVSPAAATGVAYLEVAINSQDFTTSRRQFTYYRVP